MSLEQLQTDMAKALFDHSFRAEIGMSQTALGFYSESVFGNLEASLCAGFPITRTFIGEACFSALCRRFLPSNLPKCAKLSRFGAGFPQFIAEQTEFKEWPCVGDLARLEWQRKRLFIAADQPKLSSGLKADWLRCGLVLAPYACGFASRFDVVGIIHWHEDQSLAKPDLAAFNQHVFWSLCRQGRAIEMLVLDEIGKALIIAAEQSKLADEIEQCAQFFGSDLVREKVASLLTAGILIPGSFTEL